MLRGNINETIHRLLLSGRHHKRLLTRIMLFSFLSIKQNVFEDSSNAMGLEDSVQHMSSYLDTWQSQIISGKTNIDSKREFAAIEFVKFPTCETLSLVI